MFFLNYIFKCVYRLFLGIPSLGMIKIDPLRILSLKIEQGNGPVSINMSFTDIDIINLRYVQAKKVEWVGLIVIDSIISLFCFTCQTIELYYIITWSNRYDVENYHLHFETFVPNSIIMEGDYEVTGKVMVFPVVGKGKSKFTLGKQ